MIAQQLQDYYFKNKDRLFKWGAWDCAYNIKEWGEFIHNKSFDMPTYHSALSCKNINITTHVDSKLKRISHPNIGDVVLFKQSNDQLTLGIKSANGILSPNQKGLTVIKKEPLISWGILCLQ